MDARAMLFAAETKVGALRSRLPERLREWATIVKPLGSNTCAVRTHHLQSLVSPSCQRTVICSLRQSTVWDSRLRAATGLCIADSYESSHVRLPCLIRGRCCIHGVSVFPVRSCSCHRFVMSEVEGGMDAPDARPTRTRPRAPLVWTLCLTERVAARAVVNIRRW